MGLRLVVAWHDVSRAGSGRNDELGRRKSGPAAQPQPFDQARRARIPRGLHGPGDRIDIDRSPRAPLWPLVVAWELPYAIGSRGGFACRSSTPLLGEVPSGVPSPMPRSRRRPSSPRPPAQAPARRKSWRHRLLAALTSWNRYQVGRVIGGVILTWLIGAVGLYLAERRTNPGLLQPSRNRSGASGSCCSAAWTMLTPPRRAIGRLLAMVLLVAGVGPGRVVHGERGLAPGRTLLAEERRVELRDGRPPGALQLGAARAGVDPRGPQQDHHRAAADRDHPRQPRRDRPARQAGRAGLQRRLHRQGGPDQRGHPPPGHGRPRRTRSSS